MITEGENWSCSVNLLLHVWRPYACNGPPSGLETVLSQARSQGGFGGCGRTPLFLGPKKKIDGVRVWQLRVQMRSRLHSRWPAYHGPEPNLESVDQRQTIGIPSNVHYQHPLKCTRALCSQGRTGHGLSIVPDYS